MNLHKLHELTVADVMTSMPHGITPDESLATAKERMGKLRVRHLPVRTGGRIVGILSERDLDLLASFADIDFIKTLVGTVMTEDPYAVAPGAPLAQVSLEMAERRIGSALVVDAQEHLLGIFTDTDSLTVLSKILTTAKES